MSVAEACPPRLLVVAERMADAWDWAAAHQVPMARITFVPVELTSRHLPALRGLVGLPYVELASPGPACVRELELGRHWRWSGA